MSASAKQIRAAIRRTREARERVQQCSTDAIISALARTAGDWLPPDSLWRRRAVEQAPASTGFSPQMINEAVTLTFGAITGEALRKMLDGELGDRRVLDGPVTPHLDPLPQGERRRKCAIGPELIAHFLAGNVPAPGINSICFGLLLKSANIVKLSARDPVFPALFVEALRTVDPALADCVAVLDWRREETELTRAALISADAVIAYGDDDTIVTLRRLCRPDVHFVGYGHKLSFAVIAKEAMTADNLPPLAEAAAFDASVYDQQGCLSPHVFYVEEGGELTPRTFAEVLAREMAAYAERVPRGRLSIEESAHIAKLRGAYEFRAASDKSVAVWAEPASWLVIYEEDPMFTVSCLNRTVFVKPIKHLESVPQLVGRYASNLSTVGIALINPASSGMTERADTFAAELAKLGVNRVCPIGQMQRPPLWWPHDGRPNIAELVRWADVT